MSLIRIRKESTLQCKLSEARNLGTEKSGKLSSDVYCSIEFYPSNSSSNDQTPKFRTALQTSSNPYIGEMFNFEDDTLPPYFAALDVLVWKVDAPHDKLIGELSLSANLLSKNYFNDEQWFMVRPVGSEGREKRAGLHGNISVSIACEPSAEDVHKLTYKITVISGHNLIPCDLNGKADPYVVLHMLPDPKALSTKYTRIVLATLNPQFNESFVFTAKEHDPETMLHLSVWDWDKITEDDFMGHASIPLMDIKPGTVVTDTFDCIRAHST